MAARTKRGRPALDRTKVRRNRVAVMLEDGLFEELARDASAQGDKPLAEVVYQIVKRHYARRRTRRP